MIFNSKLTSDCYFCFLQSLLLDIWRRTNYFGTLGKVISCCSVDALHLFFFKTFFLFTEFVFSSLICKVHSVLHSDFYDWVQTKPADTQGDGVGLGFGVLVRNLFRALMWSTCIRGSLEQEPWANCHHWPQLLDPTDTFSNTEWKMVSGGSNSPFTVSFPSKFCSLCLALCGMATLRGSAFPSGEPHCATQLILKAVSVVRVLRQCVGTKLHPAECSRAVSIKDLKISALQRWVSHLTRGSCQGTGAGSLYSSH